MDKKIKIEIPTSFTIDHYEQLGKLEHLSEIEKILKVISIVSDYDVEDIKGWDLKSINKIYNDIKHIFDDLEPIFLPVFEFKGVKYGIQPISKMTGGEYVDLEKRLEKGEMLEVISIIYRPIVEDKFDSTMWKIKSSINYVAGRADDLFNAYKVEDYDTEKREWRKEIFRELPISLVLGAYNFFLLVGIQHSNAILQSSDIDKTTKKMLDKEMKKVLANISAGSTLSTTSQKMEES